MDSLEVSLFSNPDAVIQDEHTRSKSAHMTSGKSSFARKGGIVPSLLSGLASRGKTGRGVVVSDVHVSAVNKEVTRIYFDIRSTSAKVKATSSKLARFGKLTLDVERLLSGQEEMTQRSKLTEIAIKAFERELPVLLKTHPDEWVAFLGNDKVGISKNKALLYEELQREGIPLKNVFIQKIEPIEDTYYARW